MNILLIYILKSPFNLHMTYRHHIRNGLLHKRPAKNDAE
ncbi:hypothetical protein BMETH_550_1 [methanotrophic bacterial endosymbiont of Bathymodiolus sp.]|nr:hypothetical protein BMETH_550_1 [methanotrophic bacterial endosymbiont of Bathymodiolus sp.]